MAVMLTMDNTLSIVPSGEGNSNDFPVLKAFQEYIDAEQAKARKRMLGLSVFFIILLVVVVCTFALVLTVVVNRNQALSDKLLDYALNDSRRSSQPPVQVVAPQPQVTQSALQDVMKPIIERLEREQDAMKSAYEKQQKDAQALSDAREKAHNEELRKAREELKRERELAKKEAERQAQIERHRQKLYPDYYNVVEGSGRALPSEPPELRQQQPKPVPERPAARQTQTKAASPSSPSLSDIKPITYFDSDDEDGVPFLLETPSKSPHK